MFSSRINSYYSSLKVETRKRRRATVVVALMLYQAGSWWVGVHPAQWVELSENVIEIGKFGHQEKIILKRMKVNQTEAAENKILSL